MNTVPSTSPERREPQHRLVVGVDIGGTKVLAALVDVTDILSPVVLDTLRVPLPGGPSRGGDLKGVGSVVADLVAEVGFEQPVSAVGVGLAGFVGTDGVPVASPNVPQITGVDVGAQLSGLCGLPVAVDNDANCVARAALARRVPRVSNLVAVTLGTGIGGGIVIDGRLVRGALGFAGEPGHMVVDRDGPLCPCGQRGCWERYASGSGLEMLARDAATDGLVIDERGAVRGEQVVAAARAGNAAALVVMQRFAEWVSLGIANLVNLLDPELVVIGGGLADAADMFLPAVRTALAGNPTVSRRGVSVEASPGGATAGAVGAALGAAGATA